MAQPVWLTPAGSLGTIPDGVFYQNTMLTTTPVIYTTVCTATSATTNRITCNSTSGIFTPRIHVMFTGTTFGGITSATRYFVYEVFSETEFSIAITEIATEPIDLLTATGSMGAMFNQHNYYRVIAGTLPSGIQCSDNGVIIGTPNPCVDTCISQCYCKYCRSYFFFDYCNRPRSKLDYSSRIIGNIL